MSFITAELVQSEAIKRGLLTGQTVTSADVELLILLLEAQIVAWLGWNPVVSEYRETLMTTRDGACLTTAYPIAELISIAPKISNVTMMTIPIEYAWSGSIRTIGTGISNQFVEVVYRAGLNPLPSLFGALVLSICMKAIENGFLESGDLDFLNESLNTTKSLSLPGGLSTSYQNIPTEPVSNPVGLRLIDKLLAPIAGHKRSVKT